MTCRGVVQLLALLSLLAVASACWSVDAGGLRETNNRVVKHINVDRVQDLQDIEADLMLEDGVLALNEDAARKTAFTLFEAWAAKHKKVWQTLAEMEHRFHVFLDNLAYVHARNQQQLGYHLGLNRFADLTVDEFQRAYVLNGARLRRGPHQSYGGGAASKILKPFRYHNITRIPDFIDWREKGALSHIKDQGQCGSCWAFSSVSTVEAVNQIATGNLISLSEQELVDCDRAYNEGCNGGLMDYAFQFIVENGGLDTEKDYPYTASDQTCDISKENNHVVSIDGYEDVPESDEDALLKAVAHQPVSVAIDAGGRDFQLYTGGVFTGPCGKELNHAVVAVGYGTDSEHGTNYWIVRNSWGEGWGEQGYFKLGRKGSSAHAGADKDGLCGINMQPSYPIMKGSPGPAPPPPPPGPAPPAPPPPAPEVVCDDFSSCPPDSTCCCQFGFDDYCFLWACCPAPSATCCQDSDYCCPHDYPICDVDAGSCLSRSHGDRVGRVDPLPRLKAFPREQRLVSAF